MGTGRTDEFRKEAVRIALTRGLSRRQVADDLGVGFSTLNKWVSAHRGTDVVSAKDRDLARENERLRREVRILCPSSNALRPICGLANGVSSPSAVKVKLRFGDASSGDAGWFCA
jgi:transposase